MADVYCNGRLLKLGDSILYRFGGVVVENPSALLQPVQFGPYRGSIISFSLNALCVRADGLLGVAPVYCVWFSDILSVD